jgi:hypothetical protein
MNRRNFIASGLAALALVGSGLSNILPTRRYVLYGDGVHDDTEALNALFRGDPVYRPDGRLQDYHFVQHQNFLITDTIHIRKSDVMIRDCHFDIGCVTYANQIVYVADGKNVTIMSCVFQGRTTPPLMDYQPSLPKIHGNNVNWTRSSEGIRWQYQ